MVLFIFDTLYSNNEYNIIASYFTGPLWGESTHDHWTSLKNPKMRKACPCHDVIWVSSNSDLYSTFTFVLLSSISDYHIWCYTSKMRKKSPAKHPWLIVFAALVWFILRVQKSIFISSAEIIGHLWDYTDYKPTMELSVSIISDFITKIAINNRYVACKKGWTLLKGT